MQVTAKSDDGSATVGTSSTTTGPSDSDYIGRHRPRRMSLLRPRVRVSQLAGRDTTAPAE